MIMKISKRAATPGVFISENKRKLYTGIVVVTDCLVAICGALKRGSALLVTYYNQLINFRGVNADENDNKWHLYQYQSHSDASQALMKAALLSTVYRLIIYYQTSC